MDDRDVFKFIEPEDLWIYDKLILSKRLGYDCGPAGVAPTVSNTYIVRPISNYRMMGKGSKFLYIKKDEDIIEDGYFWSEVFQGRHLTFDYHYGLQVLAVEGEKETNSTNRFKKWEKVDETFILPSLLLPIALKYEWMNVEVIGSKIIEVHLRYNDDFRNHSSNVVIPIWKENFYDCPCGDRVGFLLS